jgi:hypothetical protein
MDLLINKKNGHNIGIHINSSGYAIFYCSTSQTRSKICTQCADLMLVALVDSGGLQ